MNSWFKNFRKRFFFEWLSICTFLLWAGLCPSMWVGAFLKLASSGRDLHFLFLFHVSTNRWSISQLKCTTLISYSIKFFWWPHGKVRRCFLWMSLCLGLGIYFRFSFLFLPSCDTFLLWSNSVNIFEEVIFVFWEWLIVSLEWSGITAITRVSYQCLHCLL